jgi:hypothetical protein
MQLDVACSVLARLERDNEVNQITLQGFELWPLIRYCLWTELIRPPAGILGANGAAARRATSASLLGARLQRAWSMVGRRATRVRPGVTSAFISHPVNLQALPSAGLWFDRIVDPLFFLARNRERAEKFYVAPLSRKVALYFPADYLRPGLPAMAAGYGSVRDQIGDLYRQAGLAPERVDDSFARAWKTFVQWYRLGRRVFRSSTDLKRVFLSNWYFPDMMGLIAAARDHGILSIDVQHGKQGRYQGMYSWWTCIPRDGYQLMPDRFWCWGEPSCGHILASSPDRLNHLPVVGGFAWPDFYRRYLTSPAPHTPVGGGSGHRRVLVTLQGRAGEHMEPIPDFILDYLRSDASCGDEFIFRGHPNFPQSAAYCAHRLRGVPTDRYIVTGGSTNLYDELLSASHHITAFSSCCYEAEMLGVPTLLFGAEAQAVYAEEIQAGRFAWTMGERSDLERWLTQTLTSSPASEDVAQPYIVASMSHADHLLQTLGREPQGVGQGHPVGDTQSRVGWRP